MIGLKLNRWLGGQGRPRSAILALAVLSLSMTLGAPRAGAQAPPQFVTGAVAARLPAGANSTRFFALSAPSCWSAGNCVSVGHYFDQTTTEQGVVVPITDGLPGSAANVALPKDAAPSMRSVDLTQASCTAGGACVAVGHYTDASKTVHALVVPIQNGVPGQGQEVKLPQGAQSSQLYSVSCPVAGYCVAAGYYSNTEGNQPLVVPIINGVAGQGVGATQPANAFPASGGNTQDASLTKVACSAAASCVAVGSYLDSSGVDYQALVVPIAGATVGSGLEVKLPTNVGAATLDAVGCRPDGPCVAAGEAYSGATGVNVIWPIVVQITGGQPAPATEIALPSGGSRWSSFHDVACDTSSCQAVGQYTNNANLPLAAVATVAPAATPVLAGVTLPANPTSAPRSLLASVACPDAGFCLSVGTAFNSDSLLVPVSGGTPGTGLLAPVPADSLAAGAQPSLEGVGCGTAGSCVAVGQYQNSNGSYGPYVLDIQAPLAVTTTSLGGGVVGSSYSASLVASGAWGSYSWSVVSGKLPAGLSLDTQTGVISGTPTAAASGSFTVQVTGTGVPVQTATRSLSITVPAVPTPTTTTMTSVSPEHVVRPHVRVLGAKLVRGGRLDVGLRCSVRPCHGTVKLRTAEFVVVKLHGRRVRRRRMVVIASAHYSVRAGHTGQVKVRLSGNGRHALASSRHAKLSVTVVARAAGGNSSTLHARI